MSAADRLTHVLITRPRSSAEQLAGWLAPLGLRPIVQPAFSYSAEDLTQNQAADLDRLEKNAAESLLIFTSPRAVRFGLPQIPASALWSARVAAIGPTTAAALRAAGCRIDISPAGFTSEALLAELRQQAPLPASAFIVAAPGGRKKLADALQQESVDVRVLHGYRSSPDPIDRSVLDEMANAGSLLTVWTSANAMKSLSQRLPPAQWFQVCQGQWLVISERLKRLARAYGPAQTHLAKGPRNEDLLAMIRGMQ